MFESIRNAFSSAPDTMWVSEVVDAAYVVGSQLTPVDYEQQHEYSHTWELEFAEPARDGNDISHLHFRKDGQIVSQRELLSGEEATTMELTPSESEMEIVAVTTEDEVRDTSRVVIREEILTD
jgi:hypothetical protein